MAKTKTQIATLALQAMRAVEGDASPDSNDLTLLEDAYDMVYEQLRTKHLVTWAPSANSGQVPDEVVTPVVALVAASRLPMFKVPQDAMQLILAAASTAIGDITEILALDYVSDPIPSISF